MFSVAHIMTKCSALNTTLTAPLRAKMICIIHKGPYLKENTLHIVTSRIVRETKNDGF